jgi:flagellar basal-body rod protein FlgF/flagellar basal-body rod protein FlgG
VDFPHGTALAAAGNSYFTAPQGSAQPATDAVVRQGALESSNYNAIEGTVDLITVQRHAQLLEKALSIFYTDFSQAAAQELPRVQP